MYKKKKTKAQLNPKKTGRPPKIDENNIEQVAEAMLAFFQDKYKTFRNDMRIWKERWVNVEETKKGSSKVSRQDAKRNQPLVDVPFFGDFATEVDISYRTLNDCEREEDPIFSHTWRTCKEIQGRYIALATMNGLSHPSFAIFFASNLTDWRNKNQVTGKDDEPLLEGVEISVRK